MNRRFVNVLTRAVPLLALLAFAGAASADTLLVERVQNERQSSLPARGSSMAQVKSRFGTPTGRMDPRGGQKRQWPQINRWVYPTFTVYFEKDRVIDAVLNRANASEVGPKPPIR